MGRRLSRTPHERPQPDSARRGYQGPMARDLIPHGSDPGGDDRHSGTGGASVVGAARVPLLLLFLPALATSTSARRGQRPARLRLAERFSKRSSAICRPISKTFRASVTARARGKEKRKGSSGVAWVAPKGYARSTADI